MLILSTLHIDIPPYTEETTIRDMQYLCTATEQLQYRILSSPEMYEIGNEGLISLTRKFIFGIANTFFHVANNFKTMFKSYRAFKRSELRFYKESHHLNYQYAMKMDYATVRATSVPIPRGMRKAYLDSISALNKALAILDMNKKVITATELTKQIHACVITQAEQQKINRQQVTHITSLFDKRVLTRLQEEVNKCYTNTPSGEIRFDTAFASMQDFRKVGDTLLEMEAYLIGVASVCSKLEEMESLFEDIISKCEQKEIIITKADMSTLSQITLLLATVFDAYGTWIDDLNRTTHNYLLCVKKLYDNS